MAFYGEYEVSITAGDRIVLPKKIRAQISGKKFILTKGFDVCLAGYDEKDWNKRSRELLSVSLLEKEHIERKRVLFSGANEIEVDAQARFVIPKSLASYIGLSQKIVLIIGVGDHFEIWEKTKWNTYLSKNKI